MLLSFTAKNYKSFGDEMRFSMIAAPKQNDLSYSLLKGKAGEKSYKIQCSSVIYGPNASGKTNIIGAMEALKAIVMRGNIKNIENALSFNIAASALELIPNADAAESRPVEFSVEFIEKGILFRYGLTVDIGGFLEKNHKRKVNSEELYINDKPIFKRFDKTVKFFEYDKNVKKYILAVNTEGGVTETLAKIASTSLNDEELFLRNGFKILLAPKLEDIFVEWMCRKFMVIFRADSLTGEFKAIYTDKLAKELNTAAKLFGSSASKLGYLRTDQKDVGDIFCSFIDVREKGTAQIPAEIFESYGTIRFISLFPYIKTAIDTGATIVIDEFDASIHPSALMSIINIFHNDSINKNHAQLIFNTHNPVFLSSSLFRRDEIKFVQRRPDTGYSELYSLSDFGTAGKKGVRNSEDYMKYYLSYKYGAIEDVDLAPAFEKHGGDKS
ncbi:MAG: ATP-binding protein [Bacteroides sp.]|nr:ATP-binding protein [Bacteroides sp.]